MYSVRIDPNLFTLARTIRLAVFDFDGVFTDNAVYVLPDGTEAIRCWRSDGLGLRNLDRLGVHTLILSTEVNPVVLVRAQKMQIRCLQGLMDKPAALVQELDRLHMAIQETAYVGNDINDRGCLELVGLPIVVQDAHPDVVALAKYQTHARGGYGAVREVCDLLTEARK
jgi:YrbI family 3-deoxy-D-manno-octulosonate 8-phosphate phosphatase